MATLTKEQYEALKRQGRGTYRGQTSSSGQFIIEADKFVGDLQGNADTATRLRDPITISLGGDAEGSAQFAGSSFRLDATIRDSEHADNADTAENAKHSAQASHADLANIATLALRSMLANNATHADRASNADNADHSDNATFADSASSASRATYDSNGDNIHNTFVNKQQQITNNTNLLSSHTTTIADHERRITSNENKIEDLDTRVGDIETSTDVGKITQRVVNIEAKDREQDSRLGAINDTMVTLSTSQYILAPKTFNAGSKTVMDNEAGATEITNKEYVDNKVLSSANYVTDNLESYTDNKVLSASRYMTNYVDNKVLSTSQYVDDNFMSLTKSQYIKGLNTYNAVLPQSNLTPTNANDFITKKYFDENQSSDYALFDIVLKDHVLSYGNDLEGFAPLGTWVNKTPIAGSEYGYPDFVQKCLDEYNEATADTTTIGSVTLNIKRHRNGHVFYDVADINKVDAVFNYRGEAWFYGIDEANERVFLPRSTRIKFGSTSEVAQYQEAGLPSIAHTHTHTDTIAGFDNGHGGEYPLVSSYNNYATRSTSSNSAVSSIYGKSTTVEYSSTKMIPYMVVGNVKRKQSVVVESEGEIAEALANKADKDLSNCTKPYIVETYVNGTSWYRLYSDGWCEQGGSIGYVSTYTDITLLKTMSDTNYVALSFSNESWQGNSGQSTWEAMYIAKLSVSQIRIPFFARSWLVMGYVAS